MWSVTLDRTSLGLEPLVIANDSSAGLHLTEEDCTWPAFTMRRTYAPPSESVGGEQLEAKVPNQGTIGLGIEAKGSTTTAMKTSMDELTAATTQFSYELTLTVDGVAFGTWNADPEFPNWGALDSGDVKAHITKATITIPINPASA